MIKRFFIAIVLLALLAGGLVGFNLFRDKAIEDFFANMPAQTVTVSTVTVEPRSWTPVIDAIGTVGASRGVDLTVETTGIVKELRFSANDRVEENEVLLQMDDAVQQADLVATRAQAALDRQALERALELRDRGVGSAVSLQAAEAAAAASAAQVQKLEAVLQQKQLRAPFAGTLGIPRVDEGQYLSPGVAVVTLQNLDTMRADFTVPEQRLGQLRIGQKVRLTVDGDDTVFAGEITGIDPKVDPSSRLVSVRAAIDNPEGRLTPGQFVRINVELPQEDDVIALPQTALVTSLYGDYVYAARPKEGDGEALEARQVFVGVGRRSGANVEIVSGLAAGDVVVTAGQNRLSNGTPVAIDNTVDPARAMGQEATAQ
ncbi:MAG: efflux transporter periplasmic adaptor subunit [Hyphomicrobiales bacterium]|nr:MAG: efflux transporter periplasmic adaptor subunit [Hyphomicrobiales bacterium]